VLHLAEKTLVVSADDRTHVKRRYDVAQTPFDRLCATPALTPEQRTKLARLRDATNPRRLRQDIYDRLDRLWTWRHGGGDGRRPRPVECHCSPRARTGVTVGRTYRQGCGYMGNWQTAPVVHIATAQLLRGPRPRRSAAGAIPKAHERSGQPGNIIF
jgi:hypothetical protein